MREQEIAPGEVKGGFLMLFCLYCPSSFVWGETERERESSPASLSQ